MGAKPTIGRVVYFYTRAPNHPQSLDDNHVVTPTPAIITRVLDADEGLINLTVLPDLAAPFGVANVPFLDVDDFDASDHLTYAWDWMPYQKQVQAGLIEPTLHVSDTPPHPMFLVEDAEPTSYTPPAPLVPVDALDAMGGAAAETPEVASDVNQSPPEAYSATGEQGNDAPAPEASSSDTASTADTSSASDEAAGGEDGNTAPGGDVGSADEVTHEPELVL